MSSRLPPLSEVFLGSLLYGVRHILLDVTLGSLPIGALLSASWALWLSVYHVACGLFPWWLGDVLGVDLVDCFLLGTWCALAPWEGTVFIPSSSSTLLAATPQCSSAWTPMSVYRRPSSSLSQSCPFIFIFICWLLGYSSIIFSNLPIISLASICLEFIQFIVCVFLNLFQILCLTFLKCYLSLFQIPILISI